MVVTSGETEIAAVFAPVLQRKVLPIMSLVAVRIELSPTQIFASLVDTEITGSGYTTIWKLAVPVQPFAAVPVTV
ncbi:hypothetical protein SDC9_89739 [bioreactor metagenome]|uniref:Uncharacterized protein n=1 Tax=bioreactor metagenome TaxID=1076179 RepID=A0A644ZQM5_9ZZZZ